MATVNAHHAALHGSYLFSEIGSRVALFSQENSNIKLIRLGIGDVTLPIAQNVVKALQDAAAEMGQTKTMRGYAPSAGYPFLINAILKSEYAPLGITLKQSEIFISDGAKSDTANFQELFSNHSVVAVCDPVYPVYVDSNKMAGRNIVYLPCLAETSFIPMLPEKTVDVIYLCSPNNPTGVAFSRAQLTEWVKYAQDTNAAILYDAAYRAYIQSEDTPRSIYEIDGAKEVAIEFCSFSKSAGFTGLRCGWTVVPKENKWGLQALWARRIATKCNGVAYPVQRAAEAALSEEGKLQSAESISFYLENAAILRNALQRAGLIVYGGVDAPYLWVKCPNSQNSWAWFDKLLIEKGIVVTPGEGFGACGAGYVRFSSFSSRKDVEEAAKRMGQGNVQ